MINPDEYLSDLYDHLNDTPVQRKFRDIRPMPVGVVYVQWPGEDWEEMRGHLRLMKRLGYNCLKGIMLLAGFDEKRYMHMALDEGIIPWWYGEAGWEAVTPELLDRLGIPREMPIEQIREHPAFLTHQEKVMRARIDHGPAQHRRNELDPGESSAQRWTYQPGAELFSRKARIEPAAEAEFTAWLQKKYGTLHVLKDAWNAGHAGLSGAAWTTWEEALAVVRPGHRDRGFNRLKDVIRFKTEIFLRQVRERLDVELAHEPQAPVRAGGEISVFLPVAGRGVDMEGIARLLAERGSLYPSTHPAWHFDHVNYELTRTIYMYSSIVADAFKGGWSATWESTGGPQQISGYKGATAYADSHLPAYTVDEGVMTQFMLSYLAAGYRGFGFWCWSARTAGHEAGEYSLLDRNNKPGRRAVRVGQIGQAAIRWRDELWQARKQPLVGVLFDQENDMHWSVMADSGRDLFADIPAQSRVGAGRALINANIPWEHVTADNLRKGLAGRYKVIYLPAMIAVSEDIFTFLAEFVRQGGRLVMDMPGYYFDENARLTNTAQGSFFEQVFGVSIDDFQYSSNVPRKINDLALEGFVADMTVTTAKTLACYDRGLPAITVNDYGEGQAVLLGYEAALMCFKPGNTAAEAMLVQHLSGANPPPYRCDGAIVYRQSAPAADHYFIINDAPARRVALTVYDRVYTAGEEVVDQTILNPTNPIEIDLPAYSGLWIRMARERNLP